MQSVAWAHPGPCGDGPVHGRGRNRPRAAHAHPRRPGDPPGRGRGWTSGDGHHHAEVRSAPPEGRGEFHRLTVAEVVRLCADAVAVTFDVPAGVADRYVFAPGQSLTLRRRFGGREERRSYSICAPAGAQPRIGVREVPGGQFSTWLVHTLRGGDAIEVGPPTGTFTPDLSTPGCHVAIAAGSGITPVLSIAASVLADRRGTLTLLYGNGAVQRPVRCGQAG